MFSEAPVLAHPNGNPGQSRQSLPPFPLPKHDAASQKDGHSALQFRLDAHQLHRIRTDTFSSAPMYFSLSGCWHPRLPRPQCRVPQDSLRPHPGPH